MEMVQIDAILPCLFGRNWALVKSTNESGPAITSDNPVILTWNEPEKIPSFYRESPGFGMKSTQVYFPVSQNLALIGEFDSEDNTIDGNLQLISILNSKVLHNAYRQIFSPRIEFYFYGKNDEILDGNKILRELMSN